MMMPAPIQINNENKATQDKDIYYEMGLISDLVIDPTLFNKISSDVKENMFLSDAAKIVFLSIKELTDEDYIIDNFLLTSKIQKTSKQYGNTYDVSYTRSLLLTLSKRHFIPEAQEITAKSEIVRENWMQREALELMRQTTKEIESDSIDKVLSAHIQQVEEIQRREKDKNNSIDAITNEFLKSVSEQMGNDTNNEFKSGFERWDEVAPLTKTDAVYIGARPAMGKTAIALIISLCASITGNPVVFFSLEMSKKQLLARIVQYLTQIGSRNMLNGRISAQDFATIERTTKKLKDLNITIIEDIYTIEGIRRKLKSIGFSDGVIIADYLQLADSEKNTFNQNANISQITKQTKRAAKNHNSCFIWLSQLSRKCEERADKRPVLSDLRDSGGIEQDADVVAMLYRDEYYLSEEEKNSPNYLDMLGLGEIIFRKNRHGNLSTVKGEFKKGSWQSDYLNDLFEIDEPLAQAMQITMPRMKDDDIPF